MKKLIFTNIFLVLSISMLFSCNPNKKEDLQLNENDSTSTRIDSTAIILDSIKVESDSLK